MKYERQNEIMEFLNKVHSATVKNIAGAVFTSESSVRRDLEYLEKRGLVRRVYGGAVLCEYEKDFFPVELRDSSHSAVKEQLAREAAKEVFDGAVIFMDSSSTVRRIIKYLSPYRNLKIITNNMKVFEAGENLNFEMYCTGGKFDRTEEMFIGPQAERFIEGVNADLLFFSSSGISGTGNVTDFSESLTSLRRAMMNHAKKKIFLCDSSKVGITKIFHLCGKEELDRIICDTDLPFAAADL